MSKKIVRRSRIQLVCGQAKPGASLAFLKNMALFCRKFNDENKDRNGELVNVEITIYKDGNYDYNISNIPSTYLLRNRPGNHKMLKGKEERRKAWEKEKKEVSEAEIEKVAREILPSLNTDDIEKAKKIVAGTARSFNDFKNK